MKVSDLPGLYHKYVGHDNNRDFVTISQSDTKSITALTSTSWFPQVSVDKHQMGSTGPRYFVPPYPNPIAENIDARLYTWIALFGQNMNNDMTAKGLKGITQSAIFNTYWLGSSKTSLWKNVICFLTEAASARSATPLYIEANELHGGYNGLAEYKKGTNFLAPWPGGWWKLSDVIQYELESIFSILGTASKYHDKILIFRNDICKAEIKKGQSEAPYYYILPKNQKDKSELVSMVNLLMEHGVEINSLTENYLLNDKQYYKEDIVISLAQPFRAFVKDVMEKQVYPERYYTKGGDLIKPYDVTSWSLPLNKGLKSFEITQRDRHFETKLLKIEAEFSLKSIKPTNYKYAILSSQTNESYKLVFKALKE